MTGSQTPIDEPPRGWVSERSRRDFRTTAWILGGLFVIGMFVLPLLLIQRIASSGGGGPGRQRSFAHPRRAAVLDDTLYFIVRSEASDQKAKRATLMQVDIELESEPSKVAEFSSTGVFLLADTDRLWLVSRTETMIFQGGELRSIGPGTELEKFSPPFLFAGQPAVLEKQPLSLMLVTHQDGEWQRGPILTPRPVNKRRPYPLSGVKAVADHRGVHVFGVLESTLYYGLWDPMNDGEVEWLVVSENARSWWPVLDGGVPVVFRKLSNERDSRIVGHRLDDARWVEFFEVTSVPSGGFSALSLHEAQRFLFVAGSDRGIDMTVTNVRGGKVAAENTLWMSRTEIFTVPSGAVGWNLFSIGDVLIAVYFLQPLVLAFILSVLMRRSRVATIHVGSRRACFASITRRGIAQLIDAPMLIGPAIVGVMNTRISIWPYGQGNQTLAEEVAQVLPGFVGFGISIGFFLAFSYSEGKWGLTPGKWLMRIRVFGTNLQPCGMGYALVRNLFEIIDGFFFFLVGIMTVALSEKWQRVGDMAANTVVVNARPSSPRE
jgi:uncharacterized RDD family membrane protein YckC